MKRNTWWLCMLTAVLLVLVTLQVTEKRDSQAERYHPNGSEPVYVGIFGE